jgi:membrane-bound lytic murein transglycosylase A
VRFLLILSLIFFGLVSVSFSTETPALKLSLSRYEELTGWNQDNHLQAFLAFRLSCGEIQKRDKAIQPDLEKWLSVCSAAGKNPPKTNTQAKIFFETWFTPYSVTDTDGDSNGLFTGYYLPLLKGSLHKTALYNIPIYAVPNDLVKINLGNYQTEWQGKTITGRIRNNLILPYLTRADIVSGGLENKADIIAWTDNWVDLFFAQVQGSALIELPHHQVILIGYASSNGHPYTSIAKVLIEKNEMKREEISMESLRKWLTRNPARLHEVLNTDASYVFFKKLSGKEPLGTEQVPLTPYRSLAVDSRYFSFGTPIWIDTQLPKGINGDKLFQRLVIAQDTGGAIKGEVRGDIYFGPGKEAIELAGNMKSQGRYWVLLPKSE